MPRLDVDYIYQLISKSFPNGVTYSMREDDFTSAAVFTCEKCAKLGFSSTFRISLHELVNARNEYIVYEPLRKHAELHNPLCQQFEEMVLQKNPIYHVKQYYNIGEHEYVEHVSEQVIELQKPKPKRMIRMRRRYE